MEDTNQKMPGQSLNNGTMTRGGIGGMVRNRGEQLTSVTNVPTTSLTSQLIDSIDLNLNRLDMLVSQLDTRIQPILRSRDEVEKDPGQPKGSSMTAMIEFLGRTADRINRINENVSNITERVEL